MYQSEHHMGLGKRKASPPGIIRMPFKRVEKFVFENFMQNTFQEITVSNVNH